MAPGTIDHYLSVTGVTLSALAEQSGVSKVTLWRLRKRLLFPGPKTRRRLLDASNGQITVFETPVVREAA